MGNDNLLARTSSSFRWDLRRIAAWLTTLLHKEACLSVDDWCLGNHMPWGYHNSWTRRNNQLGSVCLFHSSCIWAFLLSLKEPKNALERGSSSWSYESVKRSWKENLAKAERIRKSCSCWGRSCQKVDFRVLEESINWSVGTPSQCFRT